MHIRVMVLLASGLAVTGVATGQDNTSLDGRWVIRGVPVSYHVQGTMVDILVYPAEAQLARYRISFNSVEVIMTGRRTLHTFVVTGDTLDLTADGKTQRFYRLANGPDSAGTIVGTWRTLVNGVPLVHTYRSDGDFVMEIAAREPYQLRGDTLVATVQGREIYARLQRSGNEMRLMPVRRGAAQRMDRYAWGCYGHPQYDKQAKECK